MNDFVKLFQQLEQSRQIDSKIRAVHDFLCCANSEDALWAIYLLNGQKTKRCIATNKLIQWALEVAELPEWLYKECHSVIGDTAETLARILPPNTSQSDLSLSDWMHFISKMKLAEEEEIKESVQFAWMELDFTERFLLNKWMTASISLRLDRSILIQALSKKFHQSEAAIAYRLSQDWHPSGFSLEKLFVLFFPEAAQSNYYPFQRREALLPSIRKKLPLSDLEFQTIGQGVRVQMIVREGISYLWSENGDFLSPIFPEFKNYGSTLPHSFAFEAELIGFKERILEKTLIERRIQLKKSSTAGQSDCPSELRITELVEWKGEDVRTWPETKKRGILTNTIENNLLPFTKWIKPSSFNDWADALEFQLKEQGHNSEGLLVTRVKEGEEAKELGVWKNPIYNINAVITYAIKNRYGKFSEFSFSVWDEEVLVPIGKVHLDLAKSELDKLVYFVKNNLLERFGPVRSIKAQLVFELQFSSISKSTRHKSGLVLHELKARQWLKEKDAKQAGTLKQLQDFLDLSAQ